LHANKIHSVGEFSGGGYMRYAGCLSNVQKIPVRFKLKMYLRCCPSCRKNAL